MQVAHQEDHITHAVIGGMTNIGFGISDDPAFFQILSSALYKDPMLAMVRETICNAWDAHIDAGLTDVPLSITLNEEHLIIKDFGKGIPHDLIGPIYGVYGASTKKNDGRQTGGFGLGCKSPFAYTDHFEVTSCIAGKRTIYNMSKSSADKMGKPSITPIATFPTTETGIQVKIPLTGSSTDYRLLSLVKQVVFNGDIKAILNGNELPILGLSEAPEGFILINDSATSSLPLESFQGHYIYIRYGNVIYPVERSSEIEAMWNKAQGLLNRLYMCRLVLMAPPDSISITPSRESLTMSASSVATINTLLGKFLGYLFHNQELATRSEAIITEYVDAAAVATDKHTREKIITKWEVPGIPQSHTSKLLKTNDEFAFMEVLLRLTGRNRDMKVGTWLKHMHRYLMGMATAGDVPRGLVQTWFATAIRHKKLIRDPQRYGYWASSHDETNLATKWWQKNVMYPLVQKVQAAMPSVELDDISFYSTGMAELRQVRGVTLTVVVKRVRIQYHTNNLIHLLKPTVVLTHNASLITKRLMQIPQRDKQCSISKGAYFVVTIPRTKGAAEAAAQALSAIKDIEFIDMTGRTEDEEDAYQDRLAAAQIKRDKLLAMKAAGVPVVKKAKAGLVRLDQILSPHNARIHTPLFASLENPAKLVNPEFIEQITTRECNQAESQHFPREDIYAIAKLWGDIGSVTNNSGVYDRYIKKGVKSLTMFVAEKLIKEFAVSPTLIEHHSMSLEKIRYYIIQKTNYGYNNATAVIEGLVKHPALSHLIPGYVHLSPEDKLRLTLWNNSNGRYFTSGNKELTAAYKEMNEIKLKKEITEFLDKLIANPFLDLFDASNLSPHVLRHETDPEATEKLVAIVQNFIN